MVFRSSTQLDLSYLGTLQQLKLVPLFMHGSPSAIQSLLPSVREQTVGLFNKTGFFPFFQGLFPCKSWSSEAPGCTYFIAFTVVSDRSVAITKPFHPGQLGIFKALPYPMREDAI